MQSFFTKKVPPYFVGREERLRFISISFPISKSFIPTFVVQNMNFQAKLPFFKVILYGFEISQTALGLNSKII